jgi:hypothetical protein
MMLKGVEICNVFEVAAELDRALLRSSRTLKLGFRSVLQHGLTIGKLTSWLLLR